MSNIRFIHTSDIHLGTKLNNKNFSLKERQKRREELWDTFDEVINIAKNEQISYLFIAGDMTQSDYLNFKGLKRISQKFETIIDTNVIICCGKNDPYNINVLYEYFDWPKNVYFIKETENVQKIYFKEDNLCIYSLSWGNLTKNDNSQLIYDISVEEKMINVLLLNCDTDSGTDNFSIDADLIKNRFDYCALGGKHQFTKVKDNVVYSGTPEPLSFDETGEHGIIKGLLEKERLVYDFYPIAKRKYINRNIEVNLSYSFNKILDMIKFSGDTISNIKDYIKVNLTGIVNADISMDEIKNEAKQFFYYIEFEENFTYKNIDENNFEDSDFNIIESYKLQFNNHNSNLEKKAFELGLEVLRKEKVVN
ncbi:MAG: metallophosphoesterase [Tissierellia bacterium]|nr:metallophosphoesterase [Tissierellia bacterium]